MRHPRELAFRFPLPDAPDQTQKKLLSNRPAPNVEEPAATALLLRNARRVEPALELLETRFFIGASPHSSEFTRREEITWRGGHPAIGDSDHTSPIQPSSGSASTRRACEHVH